MNFDNLKNKEFWINLIRKNYIFILAILIAIVVYVGGIIIFTNNESNFKYPELDRSIGLSGIDADKNGIRDDIDDLITELTKNKSYNKNQIKSLQQQARAEQKELLVDLHSKKNIRTVANDMSKSINCLFMNFKEKEASDVFDKIRNSTFNTSQRIQASADFDHAMSGSATGLPEGNTCE